MWDDYTVEDLFEKFGEKSAEGADTTVAPAVETVASGTIEIPDNAKAPFIRGIDAYLGTEESSREWRVGVAAKVTEQLRKDGSTEADITEENIKTVLRAIKNGVKEGDARFVKEANLSALKHLYKAAIHAVAKEYKGNWAASEGAKEAVELARELERAIEARVE